MLLMHLNRINFPEKSIITRETKNLLFNSITDAYSLSLILLISAQLGSKCLYEPALERMTSAMNEVELSPYKAWLHGRILFSAQSIGDEKRVPLIRTNLESLLKILLRNDTTRFNRFTVWALGYFTALNRTDYDKFKESMVDIAKYLTQSYFKVMTSSVSKAQKQEACSDGVWAWVMIVQSAANTGDTLLYEEALSQLSAITQQPSISEALIHGLLRTETFNDYPAWAIAIVRLATQTQGDNVRFNKLDVPLAQSIKKAKSAGKTQEWLLAFVNAQLALAREKL